LEDLEKIIKECASGNVRAQEKLYRMLAPRMFGVCLRYAKDRTEAEDNLQDGFVKVFKNISMFRFEGSFEGWVRRIMVNVCLSKYRENFKLFPVEDIGTFEPTPVPDDVMSRLATQELLELVQQLPPRYKMVFNLYALDGMNHQQISEIMGISVGTSKSNLARARGILKQKVLELYKDTRSNINYPA